MKQLNEVFSDEEMRVLKNIYFIESHGIFSILRENDEPTVENFKVLGMLNNEIVVYTADDFCYYNPEDGEFSFRYNEKGDYINRNFVPENIRDFLDEVIKSREKK